MVTTYQKVLPSLVAGEKYVVRARTLDPNNTASPWTDSLVMTVPGGGGGSSTPPDTVTGISLTAGIRLIFIKFDANTETDLEGYNIYAGNHSGFTANADTLVKEVGPVTLTAIAQFYETDGETAPYSLVDMVSSTGATPQTYYLQIKARNRSGQLSSSVELSSQPGQVDDNTIEGMTIDKLLVGNLEVALTLTSGVIQTASTGARFTIDSDNITGYRADGLTVWYDLDRAAESSTFTAVDSSTLTISAADGMVGNDGAATPTETFKLNASGLTLAGDISIAGNATMTTGGLIRSRSSGWRSEIGEADAIAGIVAVRGMQYFSGSSNEVAEAVIGIKDASPSDTFGAFFIVAPDFGQTGRESKITMTGTTTSSELDIEAENVYLYAGETWDLSIDLSPSQPRITGTKTGGTIDVYAPGPIDVWADGGDMDLHSVGAIDIYATGNIDLNSNADLILHGSEVYIENRVLYFGGTGNTDRLQYDNTGADWEFFTANVQKFRISSVGDSYTSGDYHAFNSISSIADAIQHDGTDYKFWSNSQVMAEIHYHTASRGSVEAHQDINNAPTSGYMGFRFADDRDTGVYRHAADQIGLSGGGGASLVATNTGVAIDNSTTSSAGTNCVLTSGSVGGATMWIIRRDSSMAAGKLGIEDWSLARDQFMRIQARTWIWDNQYVAPDGRFGTTLGDEVDDVIPEGSHLLRRSGAVFEELAEVDLHLVNHESVDWPAMTMATVGQTQEQWSQIDQLQARIAVLETLIKNDT